jgi:formylglycine-generating enzyme required for sulfatase activity/tRNA A-37 threonylcarbamoyl transferase component Bud32
MIIRGRSIDTSLDRKSIPLIRRNLYPPHPSGTPPWRGFVCLVGHISSLTPQMRCLNCSANGIPLTMEICSACGVYLPSLFVNTLPHGTELDRGKYRIDYVLGKGGFGITYQAVNSKLEQRIAIKEYCPAENVVRNSKTGGVTMPNSYVDEFQRGKKKFLDEAKTLAQFTDPNIVRAIDFFEENDTAYMVMELIEGQSLSQELKAAPTGKLSIPRVTEIMDILVKVLTTVHAKGVYHLDIKPENVMVTVDRGIVLVDFGSSRQVQFGTKSMRTFDPGYAPPELMSANGAVGTYSDVFELGMLLHTLLVGKPAASSFERAFTPKMEALDPSLSADWASLIRSAIALQPSERPQSVAEWWLSAVSVFAPLVSAPNPWVESSRNPGMGKPFSFEVVRVNSRGEIIHREQKQASSVTENLPQGATLERVYIPGGKFLMGSPDGEGFNWEKPQHQVTIAPFYMSKYPVTQAQWRSVASLSQKQRKLDLAPSHFKGDNRPVEQVSWLDAVEFCDRLSKSTGDVYRLPSEAEWEYACRAGTTTPFYFGETITNELANTGTQTTDVGIFPPNNFGLYDLHGNVWEWCADMWSGSYAGAPTDGSIWGKGDSNRSPLRGGSWINYPDNCRSANRDYFNRDNASLKIGFRLVCE